MTWQPDDPGPDYEGTRYDQHGDPVMPWHLRTKARVGVTALSYLLFAIGGVALSWWWVLT